MRAGVQVEGAGVHRCNGAEGLFSRQHSLAVPPSFCTGCVFAADGFVEREQRILGDLDLPAVQPAPAGYGLERRRPAALTSRPATASR